MLVPVMGVFVGGYKFYTFYNTTTEDAYLHSKLSSPQARRAAQATSEFIDWGCKLAVALGSISFLGTLARSRLGITKRAPGPSARRTPTSGERIQAVKESLRAAAAVRSGATPDAVDQPPIPRTRSLKRYKEVVTNEPEEPNAADEEQG